MKGSELFTMELYINDKVVVEGGGQYGVDINRQFIEDIEGGDMYEHDKIYLFSGGFSMIY